CPVMASRLGEVDRHLFAEGTHGRIYERLAAHVGAQGVVDGTASAVWAPNAQSVHVIGDFEGWGERPAPLAHGGNGVWEGVGPGVAKGTRYKYRIVSQNGGYRVDKADPYAIRCEMPPATASIVWDLDFGWTDGAWMQTRKARQSLDAPMSIYEVHL